MRLLRKACFLLISSMTISTLASAEPIIADHEAVGRYADIPDEYLKLVRAMWLNVPGESHSSGYRLGLELLAAQDSRFAVAVVDSGAPEGETTQHLRISRATWGDVDHETGWRYGYGEEDWYTSAAAIEQTKTHLEYAHGAGLPISALGFGWCWDMTWHNTPDGDIDPVHQVRWAGSSVGGPDGNLRWGLDAGDQGLTGNRVSLDTYLQATQTYIDYAITQGYDTVVFFTTGPVDGGGNTGESGYQRHLKNERIRDYVMGSTDRVLFDYADILCWSDAEELRTTEWIDHGGTSRQYPLIHGDNMLDLSGSYTEDGDHIGQRGALRLAKALWWMLARLSGWDPQGDTDSQTSADTETNTVSQDNGDSETESSSATEGVMDEASGNAEACSCRSLGRNPIGVSLMSWLSALLKTRPTPISPSQPALGRNQ